MVALRLRGNGPRDKGAEDAVRGWECSDFGKHTVMGSEISFRRWPRFTVIARMLLVAATRAAASLHHVSF